MAMPSSGAISYDDFRTEWSLSGAISAGDMYRDGSYVDKYERGAWSSSQQSTSAPEYHLRVKPGDINDNDFFWNGTNVGSFNFGGVLVLPSSTGPDGFGSNYDYEAENNNYDSDATYDYYSVRRRLYRSVNQNVPESGAISMNDMYSAADYDFI